MEHREEERTYRFFDHELHSLGDRLKQFTLPGFQKVPIYDVFWYFVKGIQFGGLNLRASSIAFNFLLALGPALIFTLTITPYIPVDDMQIELIQLFRQAVPSSSYQAVENTVTMLFRKKASLTLFGLLTALFFASKGIIAMIDAFNASYHVHEKRSWIKKNIIAVFLVFTLVFLVTSSLLLIVFSQFFVDVLIDNNYIEKGSKLQLLLVGKWVIVVLFIFLGISFLYYWAPERRNRKNFINAGSVFATFFTIAASVGFSYFVDNLAQLNRIFGSIGALMALMIWVYFNAMTLLIGFELNASIKNAKNQIEPYHMLQVP
ncbi:MAG: YihY family inner membrane protein [Bacteroidetes bacterium]|jgi:membrane protein|nr:YihY family inner membrane protein [Bacteroidota bacterium]